MIISEIKYNQLNERLRYDAEHYQPLFLKTEEILKKAKSIPLKEVASFSKLRRNPEQEPEKEFKYIDISNVNIFTGEIKIQILKGYEAPTRARKVVRKDDIILSTVRPNRNAVAIIPEELDNEICSTGFAVIKAEKVLPHYLFAFLKTKYAINQLVRFTMASMYPAVSEEDIGDILVYVPPLSFQEEIKKIILKAKEKENLADLRYREAKLLLYNYLGIKNLKFNWAKTYEVPYFEIIEHKRYDSIFHNPFFNEIENLTHKKAKEGLFKLLPLSKIGILSKGIEVGSDEYVDEGILFLRVSNLTETEIVITDSAEYIRPSLFEELKDKYQPLPDEVLFTKDATIGIAFVVQDDFNKFIISGGIVRIKSEKVNPYYLAISLNSVLCRSQAERYSIGAVIKHLSYTNLKNILVPVIDEKKQEEVAKLVEESLQLKKEAKKILKEGINQIENLIHKE